jgi:protein SMG7
MYIRASLSPLHPVIPATLPSPPRVVPMSPIAPIFTPKSPPLLSPTRPQAISPLAIQPALSTAPTSTTAQDLLNSVMGLPRDSGSGDMSQPPLQQSSAPQPPLLFGSGPPNLPGHSIWSMSLDDSSPNFPNIKAGTHSTRPSVSQTQSFARSPQRLSQPSWPSSFVDSSQGSQNHVGALPSSFTPHLSDDGGHRKTASANFFSNQSPRNDAFGYSSELLPQPYHSDAPTSHLPTAYIDPAIMATSGSLYSDGSLPDYRNSSFHYHESKMGFAPVSVPQLWGNNG